MRQQTGPTAERLALAHDVHELRLDGFTQQEIADVLGISRSYAAELDRDPDGAKARARKDSYGGTCETCGNPTTGSNGRDKAPTECADCTAKRQHEERYWTRERIIEAIQRFHRKHGRKPLSHEWLHGNHGVNGDGYPWTASVLRECGTWNAAIEAAGFEAETPGHYIRTEETLARLSASLQLVQRDAMRRAHQHARDYGDLEKTALMAGADQVAALRSLNSCGISEHIRRAIDLYLTSDRAQAVAP